MYSIFLHDNFANKVYLINDIFGEKPLYYTLQDGVLIFSSELKSLKIVPNIKLTVSQNSASILFRRNYIPSPLSIYNEVNKIEPGSLIEFNLNTNSLKTEYCKTVYYHKHSDVFQNVQFSQFKGSYNHANKKLKDIIENAVKKTMIADCPVGSFLSGGIDSSLITSILSQNYNNVQTFSIGFDKPEFNEAVQSKQIANYLKTEHNEYYITKNDVLNIAQKIPDIYCEPFSDSSQIPTYYLCNIASQKVKVALTGDGGDEIFGGYNRYFRIAYLWKKTEKIPIFLRKPILNLLSIIPLDIWNYLYEFIIFILRTKYKIKFVTEKIQRLLSSLSSSSSKNFI